MESPEQRLESGRLPFLGSLPRNWSHEWACSLRPSAEFQRSGGLECSGPPGELCPVPLEFGGCGERG